MARAFFRFKKFCVWHDKCAMKVGTDGTLLGAWAPLSGASRVLDIGTGSGLIALMCAQRLSDTGSDFLIDALDVDAGAVEQACSNVKASPWKERIQVLQENILTFRSEERYGAIVCNPPFFVGSLHCPDSSRTAARHASGMPFRKLLHQVSTLLTEEGYFSVILPADVASEFVKEAVAHRLYLAQETKVHTIGGQAAKRVLLSFSSVINDVTQRDDLVIECERGVFSEAYKNLTRDFYLKF